MKPFDKHWNYTNPAQTRSFFEQQLSEYPYQTDADGHLQLQTQIARTYSLQGNVQQAHAILDNVQKLLNAQTELAAVRYHLERGRTYNFEKNIEQATIHFKQAEEKAIAGKYDAYAVDALHMQAIVALPEKAIDINRKALRIAETSTDERTKQWAGSLYNNLGWGFFDAGRYEEALSIFLKALEWRIQKNQPAETFMAKWCVARTLRALNKLDEALKIQFALLEEMIESDKADGYVYEELGEIHLLKNEEVYKMYFNMAWHELKEDVWLSKHKQERLNRIKKLSEQ